MIGKRLSDKLLGGEVLQFYQWPQMDVKLLLEETRMRIDELAEGWTIQEKQDCLEETMACFKYGGSLMVYLKPPTMR